MFGILLAVNVEHRIGRVIYTLEDIPRGEGVQVMVGRVVSGSRLSGAGHRSRYACL
jgi:hypothetical protein